VSGRNLESYQESAWSSMSGLEQQLKQLELNVAEQFGDIDSTDDDDDDDDNDEADDGRCNGDVADTEGRCNGPVAAAEASDYNEAEDYVLDDSLYCIACKKAFKSDKALVKTLIFHCC